MISRICKNCDSTFKTYEAWLRKGNAGNFCSKSCAASAQERKNTRIDKECVICGTLFSVKKHRNETAKCCSVQCRSIYTGKSVAGSKHPKWKGGTKHRPHAAKTWARKVKDRDGICLSCGARENLQAHHKKEWATGEERYSLENGVTLCVKCHSLRHPHIAKFIYRE